MDDDIPRLQLISKDLLKKTVIIPLENIGGKSIAASSWSIFATGTIKGIGAAIRVKLDTDSKSSSTVDNDSRTIYEILNSPEVEGRHAGGHSRHSSFPSVHPQQQPIGGVVDSNRFSLGYVELNDIILNHNLRLRDVTIKIFLTASSVLLSLKANLEGEMIEETPTAYVIKNPLTKVNRDEILDLLNMSEDDYSEILNIYNEDIGYVIPSDGKRHLDDSSNIFEYPDMTKGVLFSESNGIYKISINNAEYGITVPNKIPRCRQPLGVYQYKMFGWESAVNNILDSFSKCTIVPTDCELEEGKRE